MSRSTYSYKVKNANGRNIISIIDQDAGGMSVTNNIENVIMEIEDAEGIDANDHMIVYEDSENIWNGFDWKSKSFVALQAGIEDEAVRKYINKQLSSTVI